GPVVEVSHRPLDLMHRVGDGLGHDLRDRAEGTGVEVGLIGRDFQLCPDPAPELRVVLWRRSLRGMGFRQRQESRRGHQAEEIAALHHGASIPAPNFLTTPGGSRERSTAERELITGTAHEYRARPGSYGRTTAPAGLPDRLGRNRVSA